MERVDLLAAEVRSCTWICTWVHWNDNCKIVLAKISNTFQAQKPSKFEHYTYHTYSNQWICGTCI